MLAASSLKQGLVQVERDARKIVGIQVGAFERVGAPNASEKKPGASIALEKPAHRNAQEIGVAPLIQQCH